MEGMDLKLLRADLLVLAQLGPHLELQVTSV